MIRINDILDKIYDYNPDVDLGLIDRAYIFSAKVHDGQMRLSGEPYLSHPLEVAGILADMKLDAVSVAAGLLHDVVEDTHATEEEIEEMFGPEVEHIVSGVTKLSTLPFGSAQARQAESIRKMLLAMADDIRVVLIKLADRVHNMRTLQYHKSPDKQRKIAKETLDIYAPIASRLGIFWVKNELENIAFEYIKPEEFKRIKHLVSKDRDAREKYIHTVKSFIKSKMDENNLPSEVLGRYKHYYSIYQKMVQQNLTFDEVYDIIAFRIILETVPQCYEALGLLHSLWPALAVLSKMLRSLYLHGEIREKGGAYGGFAVYNPESGLFSLASYRDPHIARTLKVFEGVVAFMHSGKFKKEDIKEAVLQVCSEIDKPDPPGPTAQRAFSRLLIGLSDAERLKFKRQLLQVSPDDLLTVVDRYFKTAPQQTGIAVIAGEDHLKKANGELESATLSIQAI